MAIILFKSRTHLLNILSKKHFSDFKSVENRQKVKTSKRSEIKVEKKSVSGVDGVDGLSSQQYCIESVKYVIASMVDHFMLI